LHDHHDLYGEYAGVRSARKHIGWAVRELPGGEAFRARMNLIEQADTQVRAVAEWFDELAAQHPLLPRTQAAAANDAYDDTDADAEAGCGAPAPSRRQQQA
jgi:tRNA-dihydrouridine synthase B